MTVRARSARGFTLLELLLAMSVLALVAAICYGAFHLGIRAVERGEVAVVSAQRLRVATDVLIRQIKSIVPYRAHNREEDESYPFFYGHGTSMIFVTGNGLHGGGGLVRVCYYVAGEPPQLRMQESEFFSPNSLGRVDGCEPNARDSTLLDDFKSLHFEYMMSDGVDTEWRAEWNGHEEDAIPSAVRVLVDGIPGLEVDRWGQEIPVMASLYGENGTELSEEDEDAAATDDGFQDDDTNPTRQWKPGKSPGDDDNDDGEDEE